MTVKLTCAWLLTEDDRYPGRYLLFRSRRGQWMFVRYLRVLVYC